MDDKFRNKLTKSTIRNKQNTDFSSLQKSSSYIDELEPWIGQNVLIESDDWALMPGRIGSKICDTIVFHSIKIINVNRNRSDYDVVRIKSAYVSSDCDMVTYKHYDFKKDVLIKVDKSVKMRGLFKPGKERTLQIKCNVRICAIVERDKKGKKRAVKITSIICSKVEGAGSRKICEES